MNKKIRFCLILLIFMSTNLVAVNNSTKNSNIIITPENKEIDLASANARKAIREFIVELRSLRPSEYAQKISGYRETFEKYTEHKKGVCSGEFSTIILDDKGVVKDNSKEKLTKEEKKLCFKELKATQINYINNMFHVRKKYLNYMHEIRLKELAEIRQNAINQISKKTKKR